MDCACIVRWLRRGENRLGEGKANERSLRKDKRNEGGGKKRGEKSLQLAGTPTALLSRVAGAGALLSLKKWGLTGPLLSAPNKLPGGSEFSVQASPQLSLVN